MKLPPQAQQPMHSQNNNPVGRKQLKTHQPQSTSSSIARAMHASTTKPPAKETKEQQLESEQDWNAFAVHRPVGLTVRPKDSPSVIDFRHLLKPFEVWTQTSWYHNRRGSVEASAHAVLTIARLCAFILGNVRDMMELPFIW
jgi:hypothetical protein